MLPSWDEVLGSSASDAFSRYLLIPTHTLVCAKLTNL